MLVKIGLIAALAAGLVCAQSPEDPEIARAKANIERMRDLVAIGAIPRMDLEKAETALTEATETAFLRRTLYGSDLTEEQADEVAAVTLRRLERAQGSLVRGQALVAEGVAPSTSLQEFEDRLDLECKEQDYALKRAALVRPGTERPETDEN
jgi:multidrug resistance efflux pump